MVVLFLIVVLSDNMAMAHTNHIYIYKYLDTQSIYQLCEQPQIPFYST